MVDKNVFPKGSYVVLEKGCDGKDTWGRQMPINHCYILSKDSSTYSFHVEKDIADSFTNGWSLLADSTSSGKLGKMVLRLATPEEKLEYFKRGRPYDVTTLPKVTNSYEIY